MSAGVDNSVVNAPPPPTERDFLERIDECLRQRQHRDAERLAMELLGKGGSVRPALTALGEIALAEGKPHEAAVCFEKALAEAPKDSKALMLRAEALQRAGKLVDAVQAYGAVVQVHPRLAEAFNNRGVLHARMGQLEAAVADFRAAVRVHPEYADAFNNLGNGLLDRGLPNEAIHAFRRALEFRSEFPEALNNLGLCLSKLEQTADAVQAIEAAVRVRPNFPDAWNNLGNALRRVDRRPDALMAFRKGMELAPQHAGLVLNYANLLHEMNRGAEAFLAYEHAHAIAPDSPDVCVHFAIALQRAGKVQEAVNLFRQTSARHPNSHEAQFALGKAAVEHGAFEHAIPALRAALKFMPDNLDATALLGVALAEREQFDEAVECLETVLMVRHDVPKHYCELGRIQSRGGRFRHALGSFHRALWRDSDYLDAHYGAGIAWMQIRRPEAAYGHFLRIAKISGQWTPELHKCVGNALRSMGKYQEAIVHFERALKMRPHFVDCFNDIGIAYSEVNRLDDALRYYSRAAELRPDAHDAAWNRSLTNLALGRYELGWEEYELRWRRHKKRDYPQAPIWQGEAIPDGAILLVAEQGLGDNIQFIRYAKEVKKRIGKVYYECPKALLPIFKSVAGIDGLFVKGDSMPPFDVHLPLLSLPRLFGVRPDNISQVPGYLRADPALVEKWRERLKGFAGELRVGIYWQGSQHYPGDRFRSSKLRDWEAIARLPGVRLISLQKNLGKTQVRDMMGRFKVHELGDDLDVQSGPFMDTAAVMKNLDLVVGVDSSLGHLAGALGVPTWIALTSACDWRWMRQVDKSPWYPEHRLFRQQVPDDWVEVFERIAAAIDERWPRTQPPRSLNLPQDGQAALAQIEACVQRGELLPALGLLDHCDPGRAEVARRKAQIHLRLNEMAKARDLLAPLLDSEPQEDAARLLLAEAQRQLGLPREALATLEPMPRADVAVNIQRGLAELAAGDAKAAFESFDSASRHRPQDPNLRRDRGRALLAQGQWRQGFEDWEARLEAEPGLRRHANVPRWKGEPLNGKTLLLYAEPSIGDTVLFARYARMAKARAGRALLECHPRLVRLLASMADLPVQSWGKFPAGSFDVQFPLFSLPYLFQTDAATVPTECPYVRAEPGLLQYWRQELHHLRSFSVGIHWRADGDGAAEKARNIPVANFGGLSAVPGVRLISLQKGPAENDIYQLDEPFANLDPAFRLDDRNGPFIDTAALIQSLDLVVAADSAVATLAAALGKETWVIVHEAAHWKWLGAAERSIWFPSARVFRRLADESWTDAMARVRVALERRVAAANRSEPLSVPVSLGELFDKIAILEIKAERIADPYKLANIKNELNQLVAIRDGRAPKHADLAQSIADLKSVNEAIWATEDSIRACHGRGDFGAEFVELAKAVYLNNDQRARIKRKINELLGSALVEEKSYRHYQHSPTTDRPGHASE